MKHLGVLALIIILASCSTPPQDDYQLGAMDIATQQARAYCSAAEFMLEAAALLFTDEVRLIDASKPGTPFGAIEMEFNAEHDYSTTRLHWQSDATLIAAWLQREVDGALQPSLPTLFITNSFKPDTFCIYDNGQTELKSYATFTID